MAFGTYRLAFQDAYRMVKYALAEGINEIDTAQLYRNESAVQMAIDEQPVKIYVTSKIHRNAIKKASKDPTSISSAFSETLDILPSISCMLLHSPEEGFVDAWRQLIMVKENNYPFIDIGVSNFGINHLEELKDAGLTTPYCNQIEVTPFNQCNKLVKYCTENNILVTSHSCLTKGERLDNDSLKAIANRHNCTPAQVLIKWCLNRQIMPIYRTSSPKHLKENIASREVALTSEDMDILNCLDDGYQTHPQFPFIKDQ